MKLYRYPFIPASRVAYEFERAVESEQRRQMRLRALAWCAILLFAIYTGVQLIDARHDVRRFHGEFEIIGR